MFVVMGATGHVGRAVAAALLDQGHAVTALTSDACHGRELAERGAAIAEVDVRDTVRLRDVFRSGRRAFLLNPPAAVSTDTDREEHVTLESITAALEESGLEKVVLESTYGAQPGDRLGDLSVLHDFERALAAQDVPAVFQRAAYYMSNWDSLLDTANDRILPTMLPADLKIAMVAPQDLGRTAAQRLLEEPVRNAIRYVEGPDRYSARDVAAAFSDALDRPVDVLFTPRAGWHEAYRKLSFSDAAADAYARMTAVSIKAEFQGPEDAERGGTTLVSYIDALVRRGS